MPLMPLLPPFAPSAPLNNLAPNSPFANGYGSYGSSFSSPPQASQPYSSPFANPYGSYGSNLFSPPQASQSHTSPFSGQLGYLMQANDQLLQDNTRLRNQIEQLQNHGGTQIQFLEQRVGDLARENKQSRSQYAQLQEKYDLFQSRSATTNSPAFGQVNGLATSKKRKRDNKNNNDNDNLKLEVIRLRNECANLKGVVHDLSGGLGPEDFGVELQQDVPAFISPKTDLHQDSPGSNTSSQLSRKTLQEHLESATEYTL
jgi:hypothetical protein